MPAELEDKDLIEMHEYFETLRLESENEIEYYETQADRNTWELKYEAGL